jgi:hypothetical protein
MTTLPRDHRGYPIFHAVQPDPAPADGARVDFRVLNLRRHLDCAQRRLCAICGRRLGAELHFIGGPMCVLNRVFGDGPCHGECADYARRVCPYLTIPTKNYRDVDGVIASADDDVFVNALDVNVILTKPQRVVDYRCRDYHLRDARDAKAVFMVPPRGEAWWFDTGGRYLARTRVTEHAQ